jgi:hypothetical protein
MFPALAKNPIESFWNMVCILGSARGFVCQPRAPHPAATGGGFGFGKFRRDDQPSLRYGSAGQGCPKFTATPHRLADGAFAQVKRPDGFSCRRFRFFLRDVVLHIQVPGF